MDFYFQFSLIPVGIKTAALICAVNNRKSNLNASYQKMSALTQMLEAI